MTKIIFKEFEKDYGVFILNYMDTNFVIGDLIRSFDTEEECINWIEKFNLSTVEHFIVLPIYTKRRINEDKSN